ncbi:velvet factor-domain-containing protein [Staphylotrichum tortipilum]|uniref:Velvet factor-domain-containing protein n=1 Tax=Staphylotrichum tortipilum TaxID=2831512 RepID=A0AAN6MEA3_9PEZI|nr:velvet factor-domain-containing protein [Staphylotrichum longicolle]
MVAPILASAAHAAPPLDAGSANSGDPPQMVTREIIPRDTVGGRRLWYCLQVIQQPQRARACGSGPKSSADRRPVDPPPVVELRIYEGQTWELAQEKDITFLYEANFFLFATLEHARVMAHARGTPAASNTPPVLTGMPVSGMAYLDRPLEAGYFLFPDLSVRHEGRYKLTFNLYEETKRDTDKDLETDPDAQPPIPGMGPATGGSFDFRMEVKSTEFTVFSAKKFPGLHESTVLSRTVAEQGCRVRIRRDVRMRRRDEKGQAGAPDADAYKHDYAGRRRTATPDSRNDHNRSRSMSGSTERTPYSATDPQRRPSISDYPPHGSNGSQYPAAPPQPSYAQPPSLPASPSYPPPPPPQAAPYPMQSSYSVPPPPPPPAPKAHGRERTASQSGYAPINPAPPRRDTVQHDHRLIQLAPLNLPPMYGAQPGPQQLHMQPRPPPPQQQALPSVMSMDKMILPATTRPRVASSPAPAPRQLVPLAPLINGTSSNKGPLHPSTLPPPAQYAGTKRAHDQSFRQEREESRFQDGARERGVVEDLDAHASMIFSRADGSMKDANALKYY